MDLVGIQFVKCAVGLDTASSLNTATVVVDTGGGVTLSPASVLPVANRIAAATDVTFGKAVAARYVHEITSCILVGVTCSWLVATCPQGIGRPSTGEMKSLPYLAVGWLWFETEVAERPPLQGTCDEKCDCVCTVPCG